MLSTSNNENETAVGMALDSALIEVKQTSWSIDGDQLKFQGLLRDGSLREEVVVRYTIETENEKEALLSHIPRFLVAAGELKIPKAQTNVNQFDYSLYLKRKGISYVMQVKSLSEIKAPYPYYRQRYKADTIRQYILTYCDRTFKPLTSRYVKALVFGDRRELTEDVTSAFKNLGVIHLLSISGLHISLIILIVDGLLIKLNVTRETSRLVLVSLLPFFGLFAGFGISVYRAIVQASVKGVSDSHKWSLTSLDCWCVAFSTALLLNPSIIFSIGFQLSYTMSFLIIFVSQSPFFSRYSLYGQISFLNVLLFLVSIPILSYHYYEFSLGVVFLNSVFIPFVSYILMPGLLILLFLSPIMSVSGILGFIEKPIELLLYFMETITTFIDDSTSFSFVSGRLPSWVIILWGICLVYALLIIEQRKSRIKLIPVAIGLLLLIQVNRFSPLGQILMLDVGQGDAILIKEPYNKGNYLIDTGGTVKWGEKEDWQIRDREYSLGQHTVLPVLKSLGVDKLDAIIITHPHWDHYGELTEIVNNFHVTELVFNAYTFRNDSFKRELLSLHDSTVKITLIEGETQYKLPQTLRLINDQWIDDSNLNNQSMVLAGKYGKLLWLFTGDIEQERERSILSDYPTLKADVLKVSHHGSATSTHENFLKQIAPEVTLTSVGTGNRFGHPNQETVNRLENNQSDNYRTDINGSILYTFSENKFIDQWLFRQGQFKTINK
ncbi:MAG: DNA internalization-related competence protein ComEC/Rec2 [Alkalibacterium sp.]|nr:DNA internalization-related competence protein ComEC/Rec2 [Alkalibacterium sp.]